MRAAAAWVERRARARSRARDRGAGLAARARAARGDDGADRGDRDEAWGRMLETRGAAAFELGTAASAHARPRGARMNLRAVRTDSSSTGDGHRLRARDDAGGARVPRRARSTDSGPIEGAARGASVRNARAFGEARCRFLTPPVRSGRTTGRSPRLRRSCAPAGSRSPGDDGRW